MNLAVLEPRIGLNAPKSLSLEYVINGICDFDEKKPSLFKINYRPSYQRGEAWNKDFKDTLIYSIITNYPIGTIILRALKDNDEATHEVVDGQQRLLALKEIIKDPTYLLGSEISKKIIEENIEAYKIDQEIGINKRAIKVFQKYLKNPSASIKIGFEDLPDSIKNRVKTFQLPVIEITRATDESIAQYFRYIQNQERLRAGELINSIPESNLSQFLDALEDKDKFIRLLNWNESRKEFDKIFYSMIGIFDKKLNFGTTDELIIDYVAKTQEISEEAKIMIMKVVDVCNELTNKNIKNNVRFTKRLLKFLFLSVGFGVVNYKENLEVKFNKLLFIEEQLPFFNSANDKQIEEKYVGYPKNIIDDYRELFMFGRGSHSPKATEIGIKKLSNIMNYELNKE